MKRTTDPSQASYKLPKRRNTCELLQQQQRAIRVYLL